MKKILVKIIDCLLVVLCTALGLMLGLRVWEVMG